MKMEYVTITLWLELIKYQGIDPVKITVEVPIAKEKIGR